MRLCLTQFYIFLHVDLLCQNRFSPTDKETTTSFSLVKEIKTTVAISQIKTGQENEDYGCNPTDKETRLDRHTKLWFVALVWPTRGGAKKEEVLKKSVTHRSNSSAPDRYQKNYGLINL